MNRIKHVLFLGALVALAGIGAQRAVADTPSLQDFTIATDSGVNFYDPASLAPGVDLSGYNVATGLGTITFTDTNVGSDNFAIWWDEGIRLPYFNEYGTAVNTSSLLSGESWEIGDANTSTIYGDASYDALLNENLLPGTTSNYLPGCLGATCNGDASTALGYDYTVSSGEQEVITLLVSQTAPDGGFYLQQTHPSDPNEDVTSNIYFSLSAEEEPAGSGPPPGVTPEPSTWLLMLSGMLILAWRMRRRVALKTWARFTALLAVAAVALSASARAQTVLTVPWDPTNPAAPHTAYPGANIVLGATFTGAITGHSYTYVWNYGDGTPVGSPAAITNFNDIHGSHTYPGPYPSPVPGVTSWTAVVTVNDTTASLQYTGNYLVIWENNTLQSRVNAAIDWGLWYLHQSMYHPSATTGSWSRGCASGYSGYTCNLNYGGLDANNVQAFEVNGHLASGPASDPYTSDVAEGMADALSYLEQESVASKSYTFNPATANFGCSDGTAPTTTNHGSPSFYCDTSATPVYYNASASSCTSPPCAFTFDGNSNGYYIVVSGDDGSWGYTDGMYADMLVASGMPSLSGASLPTPYTSYHGTVGSESFQNIVQDIVDGANYSQYGGDNYDVEVGYARGSEPYQGGGWWYNIQEGDDNSVSQWASIGLIVANRGFGISIPQIVPDANNMWVTASQNVTSPNYQTNPTYAGDIIDNPGGDTSSSYDFGGFGYNGSLYYSDIWSPWATTPSGMVQMSLDGIGRTTNTSFGDVSTAADQRFNNVETYYADNFCDPLTGPYASATYTPRLYTYGMFSFTKSMLLHNPNGTLTPIQYLRTQTPGVFTTNSSIPANTIDWYAALSPANGGTDPCDGVAQTLLDRQYATGYWYGANYYSYQYPFETAWALIMLQKSVFVACVNNLGGAGTPSGTAAARIDLTWTGIPSATGYEVLRGTASGGPYMEVGTTATTAYSDRTGLTNGDTYYYVLQPLNASGTSLCQSNEATIKIPVGRVR